MKAFQIDNYGGPETLQLRTLPDPTPGAGQLLVALHASAYNPLDTKLASGMLRQFMPLTFPWTPGGDFSGVIEAVGEGVNDFQVGDAVYGYTPMGGTYAEKIAVDAHFVAPKPPSLTDNEAASLALSVRTASQAIDAVKLQAGQTILIHGASGGVGIIAVQLAHARGAQVIASASAASADLLASLGADQVIDYKTTPFESVAKDVDAVLDTIGGETQQRSFAVLKPGGTLVALNQPPSPEEAAKHGVSATMLTAQASGDNLRAHADQILTGEIKPIIGKVYPLADAATAWQEAQSSHAPGKVVFAVS